MNEPFGSTNPYYLATNSFAYVSCGFCSRIIDRRVNWYAIYCSESCQRAFRTGLHERVNELFGRTI